MKEEFLKAEILNILKAYVVIQADDWDLAGVLTSVPHPSHGSINHTDSQCT